jgi:hypothetical protein
MTLLCQNIFGWEEHQREGSQVQEWDAKALHDLQMVTRWLQTQISSFWRRKVGSSYVEWMKEKYLINDPMPDVSMKVNSSETAAIGMLGPLMGRISTRSGGRINWLLPPLKLLSLPVALMMGKLGPCGRLGSVPL